MFCFCPKLKKASFTSRMPSLAFYIGDVNHIIPSITTPVTMSALKIIPIAHFFFTNAKTVKPIRTT